MCIYFGLNEAMTDLPDKAKLNQNIQVVNQHNLSLDWIKIVCNALINNAVWRVLKIIFFMLIVSFLAG